MRDIARKTNRNNVPMDMLIFVLRKSKIDFFPKRLKHIIVSLHAQKRILNDPYMPCSWILNATNEEKNFEMKISKESNVTDDKIRFIIRRLYSETSQFPKPSEIEDAYWNEFGKPDLADFTRKLRDMVDKGTLERTEDCRYYFEGLVSQEQVSLVRYSNPI